MGMSNNNYHLQHCYRK